MKWKLSSLAAIAVVSAAIGVGIANSGGETPPPIPPRSEMASVMVVGPNGQALKCRGRVVKISQEELQAVEPPNLTPEQAQARGNAPSLSDFACAKDGAGRENGKVTAKSNGKTVTLDAG